MLMPLEKVLIKRKSARAACPMVRANGGLCADGPLRR
jgi:hypothetical protein